MLQSLVDHNKLWLRRLLGVGLIVIFLLKFLFGTLIGVLLFSSILYLSLPHITGVEPWSLRQLTLWFDELSNDAKIGMAGSLVTVLGFFIALHTTMQSWKRQTAATMRMAAADAIDNVLSETTAILLRISLFTETTAKEIERVTGQGVPLEAAPLLSVLSDEVTEFRANRQRLLQLEQELIALPARYTVLFLPLSGMHAALEAIEEQVSAVTEMLWVPAPAGGTTHPDHRRHLVERVDLEKYKHLAEASDAARDKISRLQGGIRGALLSPVLEANSVSFGRIVHQMFKRPAKDSPAK
jgi:hypothetical protein